MSFGDHIEAHRFKVGDEVRENRPCGRDGHVVEDPTNDHCDYVVEWRHGRRETVDRCEIVHSEGQR
jgi:hypothetical protein